MAVCWRGAAFLEIRWQGYDIGPGATTDYSVATGDDDDDHDDSGRFLPPEDIGDGP